MANPTEVNSSKPLVGARRATLGKPPYNLQWGLQSNWVDPRKGGWLRRETPFPLTLKPPAMVWLKFAGVFCWSVCSVWAGYGDGVCGQYPISIHQPGCPDGLA